jgi:hypothetical protein
MFRQYTLFEMPLIKLCKENVRLQKAVLNAAARTTPGALPTASLREQLRISI